MSVSIFADDSIPVRELRKGQLARITQWGKEGGRNPHVGEIVMRCACCMALHVVGDIDAWKIVPTGNDCRVLLLPDKTLLKVRQATEQKGLSPAEVEDQGQGG